ncbi:ATP-binding cassette subfamily B protein/ATP-binding cassette subfamily C protein [Actinomadura luteofluorescens]|uniref:ATP-binding cassette subfamily B protein/ATP-binding cassette subfamily C protein n=2 Tax=Actinomadura luteofluorescens TaxID=46163 RepID=A0A7Y9EM67_9ACTN|nr:ABC transporter ATP-binding protein [Actinomadura luteofluorescens]NYD50249.1 ATP-binding cassette subfamily B protein/ATP-binding cassette subfamily C protein [Actinomadura luteofluorescens]
MRLPLRRGRAAPPVEAALGPALSEHRWYRKAAELSGTGTLTMARRLPTLIGQVMRLAWRASRRDLAATIAFNVAAGVFTAFGLLATTGVLTALFSAGPTPDRVRAAAPELVLVGAAITVRAAFSAGAQWAQARLRPQVEQIVERQLYELTTAIELAAFDDAEFQDDLHRARLRGMDSAPSMVDNAVDLFTAAVGVAAAAGALGVLHPVLLPLLLLTALPEGWAAVRAARLGYLTQLDLVEVRRRSWIMSDLMTERRHAAEVRSFTVRDFLLRQYAALAAHTRRVLLDLARRQTMSQIWGDVLKGIATALMYTALGMLLWRGVMPLAVAGTAVLAIRAGQTSLVNLVYALNRCYEDGLYFSDYMAYCQTAERRVRGARAGVREPGDVERQLEALRAFGEIRAEEVTFTYPDSDAPSLRGVSVRLGRGEIVALVGENGSGKTTLAKILAGLYAPQSGVVRWDDTRVGDLDPEALRRAIAVVAQDHTHWPMTAADNITMGDDLAAAGVRAGVDEAAAAAGADQVIATLPLGLDTLLDKRFADGCELSGGQWQRLAAARGFYRDAPLLICDEPTAALDARAEHHLFEQIRRHAARHGRTVLLITHRLASVRHADRVYVLDAGRVTEQGTHHDLMARDGLYAELYDLQASAYRQGDDEGGALAAKSAVRNLKPRPPS